MSELETTNADPVYGEFHAKEGLFFQRFSDGSVRVRAADPTGKDTLKEVTLDASAWASVVASMTAAGENGRTWNAALTRQTEPDATP